MYVRTGMYVNTGKYIPGKLLVGSSRTYNLRLSNYCRMWNVAAAGKAFDVRWSTYILCQRRILREILLQTYVAAGTSNCLVATHGRQD